MVNDPEFWTIVINGSSNLVIAGAMIAQTILLIVGGKLAYRQYMSHLAINKRNHLKTAYRLNREWNSLLQFIFSRTTINHQFVFEKQFPFLSDDYRNIARGAVIVNEKIWEMRKETENKCADMFEELTFLMDNSLIETFQLKKKHIEYLEKRYRSILSDLHELDSLKECKIEYPNEGQNLKVENKFLPLHLLDKRNDWAIEFQKADDKFQDRIFELIKIHT